MDILKNSDQTAQLIRFFSERIPNAGRTQLVKFLYLTDLEARKLLGRPVTNLSYIWHDHGPFDPAIYACIDRLKRQSVIVEEKVQYPNGRHGYQYQAGDVALPCALPKEDLEIAKYIAGAYGKMTVRCLLEDVVYQTEPMEKAQKENSRGQRLSMEIVDNASRIPGDELERILRAVEEFDAGGGKPFRSILAEVGIQHPLQVHAR